MVGAFGQLGSRAVLFGSLLLSGLFHSAVADNVPSSTYENGSGDDKVVVAVNVPEGAQNTDLYFHFEAPAKNVAWAGFGMGGRMDGSLMFIVYRPSDNSGEPTLSPRIASGHNTPEFTKDVNVTLLAGSDIANDRFVANFHCHNCRNWDGGQVDATSSNAPFIYAIGPNTDLTSDDTSATIGQHSTYHNGWSLNMQAATGINGVPIVGSGSSNNTNGGSSSPTDDTNVVIMSLGMIFHGVVMCLTFALIYPLGYLFLRLFERAWLHAGIQSFGLLLTLLGVISGIAVSKRDQISPNINHPHQIIGLITFILILATWTLGLIGHSHFKKTRNPSPLMKGHRILGPLVVALGFVNACIGFNWVGLHGINIAFIIISIAITLGISGIVFLNNKRKMRRMGAANSAAAVNFREGGMPMQNMGGDHGRVEYYNVQPSK